MIKSQNRILNQRGAGGQAGVQSPRLQGRWKIHRKHKGVRKEGGIVWRAGGLRGVGRAPSPPVWTAASPAHIGRRIRPSQRPDQTEPLLAPEEDRERLFVGREVLFACFVFFILHLHFLWLRMLNLGY